MWHRPNQVHKKAIEVDAHLRVKGAPVGDVYAIGDASTVRILLSILLRIKAYVGVYILPCVVD